MHTIKNGIWNAGAHLIGMFSGLIASIFVVRGLSPEAYGQLSYYLWLTGILSAVGSLAVPGALTKIRSELLGRGQVAEQNRLTLLLFAVLFLFNLVLSCGFVVWAFTRASEALLFLLVIGATILPSVLAGLMRSTMWGGEHYRPVSLVMSAGSLLQLLSVLLVSWLAPVLFYYFLALSMPIFIQFVLLATYFVVKKPLSIARDSFGLPDRETIARYLQYLLPSALIMIYLVIVWQRSEIFFLNRYSTVVELGFYNIGFTIYAIFSQMGWALINGYYPALSRLYGAQDWAEINRQFSQALVFAAMYAIPISFGGFVIMGTILPLVYGPKMLPAVLPAQILYLGLIPAVLVGVLNIALSTLGGVWWLALGGVSIAIVNLVLNILLIPGGGAVGAALANTLAQVAMLGLLLALVWLRYRLAYPWALIARLMVYGVLSTLILPALAFWLIPSPWLGLLLAVILAAGAYAALLLSSQSFKAYLPSGLLLKFVPQPLKGNPG
jgi:O-antigen/teichoic acid export membrane protein